MNVTEVKQPKLVNALEMHNLTPTTFEYPFDNVDKIQVGDFVKVCANGKERFWVEVESIVGDRIIGRVDNYLVFTNIHKLSFGDVIHLKKDNVYEVQFHR